MKASFRPFNILRSRLCHYTCLIKVNPRLDSIYPFELPKFIVPRNNLPMRDFAKSVKSVICGALIKSRDSCVKITSPFHEHTVVQQQKLKNSKKPNYAINM